MKQSLKSRFLQNTSWIILGRVYQILVNLAVSLVSVRYLGPSDYGLIHYAASFGALVTAFCTLGIPDVMVNELIRSPENQGKLLGTAVVMRMVSGLFSAVTVSLLVWALNPGEPRTLWVTAIYSGGLIFQGLETVQYFYQQKLMSKVTSLLTAVARTGVALYKVFLLASGRIVLWFAAANIVDHGLFGVLLVLAYFRHKSPGQKLSVDWNVGRGLLGKSHHFIFSGLMVALYGQMDKIMLKFLMDEAQVGYYSVAAAINNLWPFVILAVIESARPVIMELFEKDQILYEKRLIQLYSSILAISFAAAVGITVLAEPLVLLYGGAAYRSAADALRIITWGTAFSYLGVARSIWAVPRGCQHLEKYLAAIGAGCNALLNLLMIPVWGISGAALATVLTQFITNILTGFLFVPLRGNQRLICKGLDFRCIFSKKV